MMKTFMAALTWALLLSLFPMFADAQESDAETAARVHDERATELFESGDFTRALAEMETAQGLLPSTARLYNIAVCHERLGNLDEAVGYYQRFVERDDSSAERGSSREIASKQSGGRFTSKALRHCPRVRRRQRLRQWKPRRHLIKTSRRLTCLRRLHAGVFRQEFSMLFSDLHLRRSLGGASRAA